MPLVCGASMLGDDVVVTKGAGSKAFALDARSDRALSCLAEVVAMSAMRLNLYQGG